MILENTGPSRQPDALTFFIQSNVGVRRSAPVFVALIRFQSFVYFINRLHETHILLTYARVSTRDQSLDVQVAALEANGARKVFAEKVTGASRKGRVQLDQMLDYVRDGDTILKNRLDRLARSTRDLHNIAHQLETKGVALKVIEQSIDTTTIEGRLFFTMLSAIAEFETGIRKARQREGIDAAITKGDDSPYKGRPATIDGATVRKMEAEGMTPTQIANELSIARSSVYRYLSA